MSKFRGFIPENDLEKTVEESLDGSRMDDFVSEVLEAMETDSPFGGGSGEGTPPEETVPEKDPSGKTSSGEEIHYISLDDMMDQTGTEIVIRKDKTEPSPIFGSGDTKPHDRYVVTLRNKNGSASFSFWSSLADTENGNQPDKAEMLASIAQDCAEYGDSMSLEEFRTRFGYDDVDVEVAQKSYEGFRKLVNDVRKMFGEDYDEFVELASEGEDKKMVSESEDDERQWEEYSTEAVENYTIQYREEHGKDPSGEEENAFYLGLRYAAFGDLNFEVKSWFNTREEKSKKDFDPELPF